MNKTFLYTIAIILLSYAAPGWAQDNTKANLQTEGTGEIKVTPDWIVFYIDLNSKHPQFKGALDELNARASQLEKELIAAGFKKEEIRTTGYNVNKNITYNNNGRPVDSGFVASQSFVVEFPNEQARIIQLVKTLQTGKVAVNFNFSFTLSDKKRKETEKELLKRAVNDASEKAHILAEAGAVTLKRIVTIRYGSQQRQPMPYMAAMAMEKRSDSMGGEFSGFTANDIDMKDQVVVVWEIEGK